MRIWHLFADSSGESHFGEIGVRLSCLAFAPPAPPLDVSPPTVARRVQFIRFPPGWSGDWHPVPGRMLFCILSGCLDVGASDGQTVRLNAGDSILVEDTAGRGHTTRNVGHGAALMVVTELAGEWAGTGSQATYPQPRPDGRSRRPAGPRPGRSR